MSDRAHRDRFAALSRDRLQARRSTGQGHVYQGRYKSFLISSDEQLLTVLRYAERNALRAGLVRRAEAWRRSSLWRFCHPGDDDGVVRIADWPVDRPRAWVEWVNKPQTEAEEQSLAICIARGRPFGAEDWVRRQSSKLGLGQTLRPRGRPRIREPEDQANKGT